MEEIRIEMTISAAIPNAMARTTLVFFMLPPIEIMQLRGSILTS